MRIITVRRLKEFWAEPIHRDSEEALRSWIRILKRSGWRTPTEIKTTFGKRVDFVVARRTRNTLAVFDIAGNKYRLVAAVHYLSKVPEKGRVYVLRAMTHREYDRERWKDEL